MQPIVPSEALKREIWAKAKPIYGVDPAILREDEKGFWMVYHQFRTKDKCAWDIIEKPKKGSKRDGRQVELIPIATLPYKFAFGIPHVVNRLIDIEGSMKH
jgi:hypothetical protein